MKRYRVVYCLGSAACGLAFMACSSGNDGLFHDVGVPVGGEPDGQSMSTSPMSPGEENAPPGPVISPPAEEPDTELPLAGEGEVTPKPADEPPAPPDPPEPGPVLPIIVAVTPEDGAVAVDGDTELIIEFSVPMNRERTEAAYQSERIPSSGVTFSWNEESTELTITPSEPLEYDVGVDPAEVEARQYTFFLSASAEDAEGNRMAVPEEFSFSVLRQIDVTVPAVQDRDLTGSYRSNDTYGGGDCARNQINTCVGDVRVAGDNEQYKGFITFDLSVLPESMARLASAELNLQITGMSGNPFGGLGGLFLEHAAFDVIGAEAFFAEPIADLGRIANGGTSGSLISIDVLSAVELDVDERGMTQYRLYFEDVTDDDNNNDAIISAWTTQSLSLSYLIP